MAVAPQGGQNSAYRSSCRLFKTWTLYTEKRAKISPLSSIPRSAWCGYVRSKAKPSSGGSLWPLTISHMQTVATVTRTGSARSRFR